MAGSYDYGIPSVDPTSTAPSDYQSIPSSPNAFGAGVARAQVGLGQSLIQGGQTFGKVGDYYDDVAADHALNQYQDRARKLLHGDPDDKAPGPDGQMQAKPGFLALQGEQAMRARPEVEKSLDALQKDLSSGLKNPRAQEKFSRSVTGYRDTASAQIGSHTDSQALNWYTQVNKASEVNALTDIATNPDDPELVLHHTSDLLNARIKNLSLHGLDTPATRAEAEASSRRDALATQTEAIAVKDPARAMALLDKNRAIAGTKYDELATKFRVRANDQIGDQKADVALAKAAQGIPTQVPQAAPLNGTAPEAPKEVTPETVSAAIVQQESQGNPKVPTSASGAVGPGQIMPDTWKRYATPGEKIDNPADNLAVSRRITDAYMQKYGGDPQRVAVAYFSGEGNVAGEGSPTPWLHDTVDANGKRVSEYVKDVANRVGDTRAIDPVTRIANSKADAVKAILEDPELAANPEARQRALSRVESITRAQTIAAEQTAAARKLANDQAADVFVKDLLKLGPIDPGILTQIRDNPNLDHSTKLALGNAVMARSGSDVDKARQDYGAGFWAIQNRIMAAPGTPNRVTEYSQLLHLAGPDVDEAERLTLPGVEKLNATLKELAKPESASNAAMKQGQLAYAKSQLSFEMDTGFMKIRDPNGEADFNSKFIPAFYNALEAGLAAGKTPAQLLTKEYAGHKQNPDYIVDDLVSAYKRTPAQIAKDRINAFSGAMEGAGASTAKPWDTLKDPAAARAALKDAVGKGDLSMEDGLRIGQEKGWIRKTSAEAPPAPPTR